MVSGDKEFASVADAFKRFMQQVAYEYSSPNDQDEINHVILVAHNGKAFDIPFFSQQLSVHQMLEKNFADKIFGIAIDTLQVPRWKKKLYMTRTMLANRIPQAIRIAKTSPAFRQMTRGYAIKCKVRYRSKEGKTEEAGLVWWRDRNMVYCLSNDSNNQEFDECSRRGNSGIIQIFVHFLLQTIISTWEG
jgi:hypothetical protein